MLSRPELQRELRLLATEAGFAPAIDLLLNETQECAYILLDWDWLGISDSVRPRDQCAYILGKTTQLKLPRKLGESRLGGLPDLPEDAPWPQGVDENDRPAGYARFFAQFNLADLPDLVDLDIPRQGLLSVFARRWHFTQESFLAIYSLDVNALRPRAQPVSRSIEEDDEQPFLIMPIRFERGFSLPFHRRSFRDLLRARVDSEFDADHLLRFMQKDEHAGQIGGYSHETEVDLCRRIALTNLGHPDYEDADAYASPSEYESERALYSKTGRLSRLHPKVEWIQQHRSQIDAEAAAWRLLFSFNRLVDRLFGLDSALSLDIFIRSSDLAAGVYDTLYGDKPQTL